MKVKVCGMRDPENLNQLIQLNPDYIGFIFYERSKRFVGNIEEELLLSIPEDIKKTGVFVDVPFSEIKGTVEKYGLNAVQLHGSEDAEYCKLLKEEGIEVIKAFGVDESFDFSTLNPYVDSVDFYLFDTKTIQHGGSGKVFNWDLLKGYNLTTPYFLSGGLSLDNLNEVSNIKDQKLYAIDINSRFETEPGLKDIAKVKEALALVRLEKENKE